MPGIATESAKIGSVDLVSEIKKYLKKTGNSYLGVIHRLDQPVEGILVFAKNKVVADNLTKQVQFNEKSGKGMIKKYKALVYGHLKAESGTMVNYLVKNAKDNISFVVPENEAKKQNAKKAVLEYRVLSQANDYELVDIKLLTGRHHQIRVQFAEAGCPLIGDLKYGNEASIAYSNENGRNNVQLKAYRLEFYHPDLKKRVSYEIE